MTPSTAVDIAGHYHHTILILFVLGYVIHAALQVDAVARAKNNPTNLRMKVVEQNGIRLTARFFISLMLFLYFWHNPAAFASLIGVFGIPLSDNAKAILTLPMSPPVAGAMGFAVDSLLAYVPVLKNALPAIEFTQTTTEKVETTHTVTVATDVKPDGTEKP